MALSEAIVTIGGSLVIWSEDSCPLVGEGVVIVGMRRVVYSQVSGR